MSRPNLYGPICDCGATKDRRSKLCQTCWNEHLKTIRRELSSIVFIHNGEPCRYIALTKGQKAICSDIDFDELSKYNWFAVRYGKDRSYRAVRYLNVGSRKTISMHEQVCPPNPETNHRNRDTLDNSRNNLRQATRIESVHAVGKKAHNTSGYKGVFKMVRNGKWTGGWKSQIVYNHRSYHLGVFDDPYEAHLAYQRKARELVGEFASFE